jgi:hypothetical protein
MVLIRSLTRPKQVNRSHASSLPTLTLTFPKSFRNARIADGSRGSEQLFLVYLDLWARFPYARGGGFPGDTRAGSGS